jgi:hypothetical protein
MDEKEQPDGGLEPMGSMSPIGDKPDAGEEQPIPHRIALAGEQAVTETAVGDARIWGWQPRDLQRPDEEQPAEQPEQLPEDAPDLTFYAGSGVLEDGRGEVDKVAAIQHHWVNSPDWF